jgi:hypothetical protein
LGPGLLRLVAPPIRYSDLLHAFSTNNFTQVRMNCRFEVDVEHITVGILSTVQQSQFA